MANTQYYLVFDNTKTTYDSDVKVNNIYGNYTNFKLSFLKFDLTTLGSNIQITKATLGLFASYVGIAQTIKAFYSSFNGWSEKDYPYLDLFRA